MTRDFTWIVVAATPPEQIDPVGQIQYFPLPIAILVVAASPGDPVVFTGGLSDAEAHRIVNDVLLNLRPRSALSQVSQQQLEAQIAQYMQVIQRPPTNSPYPTELYRAFNQARVDYLRTGVGTGPGAIYEFAEQWLARQSPEWLRANAAAVSRLLASIDRWKAQIAQRALQMRNLGAGAQARPPSGTVSRVLGGAWRFATGPFGMAITEVLVNPTPTAGPALLPRNTLMFPPSSPEIYYLPRGTFILPNGLIYIPDDTVGNFTPPAGSFVVRGRVVGNNLQPGATYAPATAAPVSLLPWILLIPNDVTEQQALAEYNAYIQAHHYAGSRTPTMNFTEWARYRYRNGQNSP
jgi:hypothetical protein